MLLGGLVNFDTEFNFTHTDEWSSDHTLACVQLYDSALSERQVVKAMSICNALGTEALLMSYVFLYDTSTVYNAPSVF